MLLGGCAATRGLPISAPGELLYRITVIEARTVDVEILRVREGPAAFDFTTPVVSTVLVETADARVVALPVPPGGALELPNEWVAVRYRYLVDAESRDLARGIEREGDLLLPTAAVLLHPRVGTPQLTATIKVDGPTPFFPWPRQTVTAQQLVEPAFLALGGRRCGDVALLGPVHPLGDLAVCEWLRAAAEDARIDRVTIAVIPVASDEASPYGQKLGRSLAFLIGIDATTFANDTVALHTLLHLAIPPNDTWLTEGFATYLTEAARGRHTPEAAWAELREGLLRGAELAGNQPLDAIIREEGVGNRLTAATWAGVLFALELDLSLGGKLRESLRTDFKKRLEARRNKPAFEGLPALLESLGVGENGLSEAPRSKERDALMR